MGKWKREARRLKQEKPYARPGARGSAGDEGMDVDKAVETPEERAVKRLKRKHEAQLDKLHQEIAKINKEKRKLNKRDVFHIRKAKEMDEKIAEMQRKFKERCKAELEAIEAKAKPSASFGNLHFDFSATTVPTK
eukprot:m51a1_g2881 hypothetical protein (135) ;mRNA; f:394948-395467